MERSLWEIPCSGLGVNLGGKKMVDRNLDDLLSRLEASIKELGGFLGELKKTQSQEYFIDTKESDEGSRCGRPNTEGSASAADFLSFSDEAVKRKG